jgi:hypothetical protein
MANLDDTGQALPLQVVGGPVSRRTVPLPHIDPSPACGPERTVSPSVHDPSPCGPKPPSGDGSAGEDPVHPSADGLVKAPSRTTLPDFWGPMDPIGVQKSDSPRERASVAQQSGESMSRRLRRCMDSANGVHSQRGDADAHDVAAA